MKYKKYILFGFDRYHPNGGLGDIVNSFDTRDEAYDEIHANDHFNYDYFYVIDRDTWEEV